MASLTIVQYSSNSRKGLSMKRFLLLGSVAPGLIALTPAESKADEGVHVYIGPAYRGVALVQLR